MTTNISTRDLDDNMAFCIAHEDPFVRAHLIPDYLAAHLYARSTLASCIAHGRKDLLPTVLVIEEVAA